MYETAKETLMYRTVLWTLWERERVGKLGRMAMKHVKYHVGNELSKKTSTLVRRGRRVREDSNSPSPPYKGTSLSIEHMM